MSKIFTFYLLAIAAVTPVSAIDYSTIPQTNAPATQQYQDQKTQDEKYQEYNLERARQQNQLQDQRLENQRWENQRWENQRQDQRVQDARRDANRHVNNYNNSNYYRNGIADASNPNSTTMTQVDKDSEEGRIADAIRRDLKRDKSLSTNAQNIDISVNNKVVTLKGTVDTKDEKARVESIAKDAFGVRSVNNQLQISNYDAPKK